MIAFFGTGLLGSNFVRALRRRGEAVHVWNRTTARARALEAEGARVFEEPAAAVRGAARVHLTVSDDAAVDDVLERARPGLEAGVVIVDHTTTSPAGTAARAARWAERGIPFQHAPVFMGPQNALEGTGVMMASGDHALFVRLEPELAKMSGKVVYLGPTPERAAAMKLLGNLFLITLTSGIADALALAKALGVSPQDAAGMLDWFNPGLTMPGRWKRVLAADYEHPSWELAMARKDARLMMEAAARAGVSLDFLPAAAAAMDTLIGEGHAHADWTVLAKRALDGAARS